MKFTITVKDLVTYFDIEAENENMARTQALEWWDERKPCMEVIEIKEN